MREPRAASTNVVRAVVLVAVAVVLGVVIAHYVGKSPATANTAARSPTTTAKPPSTTAPPTTSAHAAASTTTSTTAPLKPPSQVVTLVANGTKTNGAAARVQGLLQKSGYDVLAATNTKALVSSSTVYYAASYEREATAVAELLGLAPSSVLGMPATPVVTSLRNADVLVVVGPDLANASSGSS